MRRVVTLVVALACMLPFSAAPEARDEYSGLREVLHLLALVNRPGISGFESDIRNEIRGLLPESAQKLSRVDEAGNLIVTLGRGKPHVLICTNMDEDGFFVSAITGDGYLRVHRVTTGVTNRLFEQMHYGQPMIIRTQAGTRVPGVFVTASSHLQRGGRGETPAPKTIDDLWVDVGAQTRSDVDKLGVQILDPASLRERSQRLGEYRVAGAGAQGRANVLALVEFLRENGAAAVTGTVTVAWTVQGSASERGAARLARQFSDVDRVIVVARTPLPREGASPKGAIGQLGAGFLAVDNDAKTIELAKGQGLAVQPVAGVLRAPNAWPPAKTQVLGVPVLFAQSTVETVDARDLRTLADLLQMMAGQAPAERLRHHISVDPMFFTPGSSKALPEILRPLVALSAVSGAEKPVRDEIVRQLPKWAKPEIDERGNLTVNFGQGGKDLLFVAHMDEIGYEITNIAEDGTAAVRKVGGFFDYLWEAHPVFVQTAKGVVPAIVAPRPNYLAATEAAPKATDVALYFGTNSRAETEALGVANGHTATIRKELTKLAGSRWAARAMDDRCGVATLLAALHQIVDPAKVPNRVTFAFVVGEETGLVGSGFLAQRSHPAVVFAIDTFVSSDSPVDPQRFALVPLGSGPVARAIDSSSITPPETVARIVAVGAAHKIHVTPSNTSGGNDGSQFAKYGSIVAPLSWPGRYSHSPVEVMDLRDLEQLVTLVVALTREF
jgi:putative aminopeptidase FrvX